MKTGIIIIFHDFENEIDKNFIIDYFEKAISIEFCLVNNDSKDNTYHVLKYIKESCSNVSIVNIKKIKSENSAVRSGARYMVNKFRLFQLGYMNANSLNEKQNGLNSIIKTICENQDAIINFDFKVLMKSEIKQTLFQRLYSVVDCLNKLEIEKQYLNLKYQDKF